MNGKSNLIYALAAVTSLALGLGVSFWRAADENRVLTRANLAADMALGEAQDEIKFLQEKLQRETKTREYADTARIAAERNMQAARDKLTAEIKTNEATEAARMQVAARLEATEADLHAAQQVKTGIEAELYATNTHLSKTEDALKSIETAWQLSEYKVITLENQLKEQASAHANTETALSGPVAPARPHGVRHIRKPASNRTAHLVRRTNLRHHRTTTSKRVPILTEEAGG
jgi:hypothetical protein